MIHRTHFLEIKHHLVLTKVVKGLFEVIKQVPKLFRYHYHIIDICLNISSNLSFQDDLNALLIRSSPVLEAECHLCTTEDSKWSAEHCFFFIVNGEADLMIARIGVQK
jgi:hypothetical protein